MKYVVLNNAYSLRNEENCSFIVRKNLYLDPDMNNYRTIYPIPPFLGYIFSNIGKMDFSSSLSYMEKELKNSIKALQHFILQIIEKPSKSLFFQGEEIVFPEKLLVYSNQKDTTLFYTSIGFSPMKMYKHCRPQTPLMVNYMVTEKCNTNCIYCYAKRDTRIEMSTSEVIKIINDLSVSGVINLTITGGDIFAREDWYEIISTSQKAGFSYLISTKTILGKEDIIKLKNLGIPRIQFSLDAISVDILQEMINVKRNYVENLKVMFKQCTLYGIDISLRTVLCKQNTTIEEIEKLCSFVEYNPCIVCWTITPAFYSENKKDYNRYSVDNDNLVKVLSYLRKRKIRIRPLFNKLSTDGYKLQRASSVEKFVETNQICYANTYSISILPSGDCTICEMLYYNRFFILGNIKEQKLIDIWNSEKAIDLFLPKRENITQESACSTCLVFDKCKRQLAKKICYVDVMKVYGLLDFPDPKCPQSPKCNYIL